MPSRELLIPLCCAALLTGTVQGQSLAPRTVVTFGEAVREALVHNARALDAEDGVEQSDLAVRLARNAFQPKVVPNVQGSFGQTDVANQNYRVDLSQRLRLGTEMRVGVGAMTAQIPGEAGFGGPGDIRFYNADTTVSLNQPLLRGFGTAVTTRSLTSAEAVRAQATARRALARQALVLDVAATYYQVVAQEALVAVAGRSLERSRQLEAAARAKLEAGLVSQLDVLRAQQLVSQAEMQAFDAGAAVEDGLDQLRVLMGRTTLAPFTVAAEIPARTESLAADRAVTLALANRLDLRIARTATVEASRRVSYARNQLLPQFDLNLALTRRETAPDFASSFGLNRFRFATFFTIAMPVDRTPQQIEYQGVLIERDRLQRDIARLEMEVTNEARRAVRAVERGVRVLAAVELQREIGRTEVDVARLRFDRGLSNNLDVVTAEMNLLSAEGRRLAALVDLAVSRLALRAALGVLDTEGNLHDLPALVAP